MGTSVTSILENPQERSGAPLGQVCRADWLIPGSRQTKHQTADDLDENADSPAGVSEFVPCDREDADGDLVRLRLPVKSTLPLHRLTPTAHSLRVASHSDSSHGMPLSRVWLRRSTFAVGTDTDQKNDLRPAQGGGIG